MSIGVRRHNREHFFKYLTAATAILVLRSGKLRWSSPALFNDPFDVPREIAHGFTAEDVSCALADFMDRAIENPPEDLTDYEPSLRQVLTLARSGFPEPLKNELRKNHQELRVNFQEQHRIAFEELRAHWRALVPTMRILCLTESPRHVAMWYHYADQYKGIVLGFLCPEDSDNCFAVAERVMYPEQKPDVYTDRGLARLTCLTGMAASNELIRLATYTKADDWSYEKEWRILSYADAGDTEQCTDWSFNKSDLAFVYLGPLVKDDDAAEIVRLSRTYSNIAIFRTTIGMDRELHFQRIDDL